VEIDDFAKVRVAVHEYDIARMRGFRLAAVAQVLVIRALEVVVSLRMRFPKKVSEDVSRKLGRDLTDVDGLPHNSSLFSSCFHTGWRVRLTLRIYSI
jgi:hypothetical protein